MRVLITGTAGFIGYHLARRLLEEGCAVTGVDGMTPYYDRRLKEARQERLEAFSAFEAHEIMLEDGERLARVVRDAAPEMVVHLAAQAGVRYSLEAPAAYVSSNIVGTFNLLEACRTAPPAHLLLASTSSVYGGNEKTPFAETDRAVSPLTIYAATKLSAEAIAHCYAHLWAIPTTVFRFFTVYGPWGRPDMAPTLFTKAILEGRPIEVFNDGRSERDFTYIDDLVEAVQRLMATPPDRADARGEPIPGDTLSPVAPFRVVNIGGGRPVRLTEFIAAIEHAAGRTARRIYKPLPKGDVPHTSADTDLLRRLIGQAPATPLAEGVAAFVAWYREWAARVEPALP